MDEKRENPNRLADRRRHRRYSMALGLKLNQHEIGGSAFALITQVSAEGVSLWTRTALPDGSILILNKGGAFPMIGEVRRTRLSIPGGAARYSVAFRPKLD